MLSGLKTTGIKPKLTFSWLILLSMFIWLAPDINLWDYLGLRVDVFCAVHKAFDVTAAESLSIQTSVFPADGSPFQKGIM